MDTQIPINVVVGDRTYRIRLDPVNEEIVRGTVKLINDRIIEYKTQFAGKDMQDYIAMVILWYATQQKEAGSPPQEITELREKMVQLESLLDKSLL